MPSRSLHVRSNARLCSPNAATLSFCPRRALASCPEVVPLNASWVGHQSRNMFDAACLAPNASNSRTQAVLEQARWNIDTVGACLKEKMTE
eukprot:1138294-Pelagomonas_calceolata.AAC.8